MSFIHIVASILGHNTIHSNIQHPRKPPNFCWLPSKMGKMGMGGPLRTWWRTHFGLHLLGNWPEEWRVYDGVVQCRWKNMEIHWVNDVSKPLMNLQDLAAKELGDISRRYSLEDDHRNWKKHVLKAKQRRFTRSVQMTCTFSWEFRKIWPKGTFFIQPLGSLQNCHHLQPNF